MATKPSLSTTTTTTTVPETESPEISKAMDPKHVAETQLFVKLMSIGAPVPENCNTNGYFDSFIRNFIKVDQIQRGRISCTIVAKPPICVTETFSSSLFSFTF
jgi:acyl-coenzyme A thioesterase 13